MPPAKKTAPVPIFFLAVALIYLAFHFLRVKKDELPTKPSATPIAAQANPSPAPVSSLAPPPTVANPAASKVRTIAPPAISKLREEIRQDVHGTPPSLLRFGADLGVRMKNAKRSKPEAIAFLKDLKSCAQPAQIEESPVQARALCLVSARELEQAWPDLHEEVDDVVKNSDPKAIQLAAKLGGSH